MELCFPHEFGEQCLLAPLSSLTTLPLAELAGDLRCFPWERVKPKGTGSPAGRLMKRNWQNKERRAGLAFVCISMHSQHRNLSPKRLCFSKANLSLLHLYLGKQQHTAKFALLFLTALPTTLLLSMESEPRKGRACHRTDGTDLGALPGCCCFGVG